MSKKQQNQVANPFRNLQKYSETEDEAAANEKVSDDWRSSCSSLVQQWGEARRRNLHTDVEFKVGERKTTAFFPAHKIVLAFGSPVFEVMFYGQLAEEKSPISIVDIDPGSFENLLRYFYGEAISFTSVVSAAKTYFAAEKYLVDRLKTAADNYMSQTTMNNDEFWGIIQEEKFFHISAIKTKYLDYFSKNASTLLKSKLLLNLSVDVVKAIFQLEYLNASEYELLSSVSGWGQGSSTAETKSKLKSLLPYIRFSNLTAIEFSSFDESYHGIIGLKDSMAILKHLCNPSKFKLPEWCCSKTQRRNMKNLTGPSNIVRRGGYYYDSYYN